MKSYKGNRLNDDGTPKQPKPVHYQAIKDYLLNVCKAEVVEGDIAARRRIVETTIRIFL